MTLSQTRKVARGGFTLIELLVVIAIIAILVSLTAVAVMRVLVKGPEIQDRNDIAQLSLALGEFNTKFKDYPPSRLILHPRSEMYGTSQLDTDSKVFLLKMWPRLGQGPWGATGTGGLDWNGDGTPGNAADSIDLHGQHCLVFFLGGMQTNSGGANGCLGFSTNPTNPTEPPGATSASRVGPFYDFKSNRLDGNPGSFSYLTPYGAGSGGPRMPYLYFSSGKSLNNYLRYGGGANSDCAPFGLPYTLSGAPGAPGARYHNQDSFQIISAGANQQFGPGGPWTSAGASSMPAAGKDDMTNFHSRLMGIPE